MLCCCFNTQPPEGGWVPHQAVRTRRPRFNTQPPEGGWPPPFTLLRPLVSFNTQPPEGGWHIGSSRKATKFQHTAARRRLAGATAGVRRFGGVSTHSRPKAAGGGVLICRRCWEGFNTQPPEGGWFDDSFSGGLPAKFQHTAARRRLVSYLNSPTTRASPSFNTQPPEGGWSEPSKQGRRTVVSTHSRPKAAGDHRENQSRATFSFQHTAARRRLGFCRVHNLIILSVSTHSRPKAAGK